MQPLIFELLLHVLPSVQPIITSKLESSIIQQLVWRRQHSLPQVALNGQKQRYKLQLPNHMPSDTLLHQHFARQEKLKPDEIIKKLKINK